MRDWLLLMGFEDKIRKVIPYTPGEQPKDRDVVKLNTNENPYPPAPSVAEAAAALSADELRLYPDPTASALTGALAAAYGVSEREVFVGVGSDDVLAMCFLTFFNSDKPVLFPDITYSFYEVWADLFRIPYETVPLDERFRVVPSDYMRENGGIIFPNPNAPTGQLMEDADIEKIIASNGDSIVIVDEAYIDFGGRSALPLIRKYKNLVVVQTFSKSRSAAGLRVGYAFACEELIKYLNDVKYSFNSYTMSRPTIELGCAVLGDAAYYEETRDKIIATRERSAKELRAMGFQMEDSSANFLFVTHPDHKARDIFEYLRKKGIYVRWWDRPRISDHLRITVGTDDQMERLFAALRELIAGE